MLLTVVVLLAVTAFVTTIISIMGKAPLWVPVLLLSVLALVQSVPMAR